MRAEIVGVGTELLLGQIANTNAVTISRALASAGVDVLHHSAVGDNHARIVDILSTAVRRSDAVVVTGGLGPTSDDITREAVADLTGRALERDERLAALIREVFDRLGRVMPDGNLRQADLPAGATPIDPVGTAPGFFVEHEGCLISALPGVPWEMEAMLKSAVLPELKARAGEATIVSRQILVVGLGESHTQAKIADIVEAQTQPTIAYLAGHGQVRLRLTAKAATEKEALGLIRPVEAEILSRLGEDAVAGDHEDMAEALGALLRAGGISVAAAESLTGGLVGAALSRAGGASDFFLGAIVAYATEAKRDVCGIDESVLLGPGAVSRETAAELAEAAARIFSADLGLGTTGVAGPTQQEGKPVGTIFVAATFGGSTEVREVRGYGDRENVRGIAVSSVLDLGRRLVASSR